MFNRVRDKWRPHLSAVVLLVLGLVLCLPVTGLFLFKFYANQLVQQTEESLLSQASVLSATYARLYIQAQTDSEYTPSQTPNSEPDGIYAAVFPSLSLSDQTILPPRPDAVPILSEPDPIYRDIGKSLSAISKDAQKQTLVGYRLLDVEGNVIGGSAEIGMSLASVPEITRALTGRLTTVARVRVREAPEPRLYALSRGTRVRVFVAMPVMVDAKVIGAVYLSRTPNHVFRFLYGERFNLIKAVVFVLLATGLIG